MAHRLLRDGALVAAVFIAGFAAVFAGNRLFAPEPAQDPELFRQQVRAYLLENPEILIEMSDLLEQRQKDQAQAEARELIAAHRELLFANAADHVVNPDGRVPVVEFFDYQCGYCKRFFPDLQRYVDAADDVRFIFKELPILGDTSTFASRAAIAAKRQGKYFEMHQALMALDSRLTETGVIEVARGLGLDVERLRVDMQHEDVLAEIRANMELARALNIRGTPTILVGDILVPGVVSYDRLGELVQQQRESCAVC